MKDQNGATPLFTAADSNNVKIVQLLIESGANIAATDRRGHTVFYMAAYCGAVDVFKVRRFHIMCRIL